MRLDLSIGHTPRAHRRRNEEKMEELRKVARELRRMMEDIYEDWRGWREERKEEMRGWKRELRDWKEERKRWKGEGCGRINGEQNEINEKGIAGKEEEGGRRQG